MCLISILSIRMPKDLISEKGPSISIDGISTLISSSFNNAPIYHISIYLLPKTMIKELRRVRRTFFLLGGPLKEKIPS